MVRTLGLLGVLVLGCSQETAPSRSSFAPSKKIHRFSIAETTQYCQDLSELQRGRLSTTDTNRIACADMARLSPSTCKQDFDQCMQSPPPVAAFDCGALKRTFSCMALTVSDLDACMAERLDVLKSETNADPCAEPSVKPTPTCQAIEMKCGARVPHSGSTASAVTEKVSRFANRMCACKDKSCANQVNDDMARWGAEMAKTSDASSDVMPAQAVAERASKVMTKYTECFTALMMRADQMQGQGEASPDER